MTLTRRKRAAAQKTVLAAPKQSGKAVWSVCALCCLWGVVATVVAITNHWEIARLHEDAEVRRGVGEERVRALTRRLVGVASHQMLEQEGLAGRLEDILTRQVDLEARLAALATVAERAAPPDPGRMR
ncbi:hypothetical protein ACFQ12_08615, partial [Methylobacterium trifolii]